MLFFQAVQTDLKMNPLMIHCQQLGKMLLKEQTIGQDGDMMGRILFQDIRNDPAEIRIDKGFPAGEIKEMRSQRGGLINGITEKLLVNAFLPARRGGKQAMDTGEIAGICEMKPDLF